MDGARKPHIFTPFEGNVRFKEYINVWGYMRLKGYVRFEKHVIVRLEGYVRFEGS